MSARRRVEVDAPAVAAAAAPAIDDTEALRVQIAALQAQLEALDATPAPASAPATRAVARHG